MYVSPNFKTKKALKTAVANGEEVIVFDPGPFDSAPKNGRVGVEGPHYPELHRWWAQVTLEDGKVIKVE